MIHHVWGLFTHPDQEWQEIRGEEETISHMYLTHVLILAAIPAVSAYIGTTQVGWAIGDRAPVMLTEGSAMVMAIMSYLAMLAGVMLHSIFTETETNLDDHTFRIGFLQAADRGFLAAAPAKENRDNSNNKEAAE